MSVAGLELSLPTLGFALLAALSSGYGARTAAWLFLVGRLVPGFGCSGGELFWADGRTRRASLSSPQDGQRMASLPCALLAAALDCGWPGDAGALTAYELLGAEALLRSVADCGYWLELT